VKHAHLSTYPDNYPFGQNGDAAHPAGYDGWPSDRPNNPTPGTPSHRRNALRGSGANGGTGGKGVGVNAGRGGARGPGFKSWRPAKAFK